MSRPTSRSGLILYKDNVAEGSMSSFVLGDTIDPERLLLIKRINSKRNSRVQSDPARP